MRNESGQFIKGNVPWHKGKKGVFSVEYRKKLSDAKKGKPNWRKGIVGKYKHTEEWKQANSERMKGHKTSEETKAKISEANKGDKNGSWRGGVSIGRKSRLSEYKYRVFRKAVINRDKHCVKCGCINRLEVDHIKPYCLYEDLRMDFNNARTLCHSCHKKTDTYGIKAIKYAITK